jgi:hypothetical protein
VYLEPDRPGTIADIARELRLDDGGLTRESDRLERAGLIRSERVGRNRTLLPNEESPYFRDLYNLLLKAFGPAVLVSPALAGIEGIELAYIFGSWAARYSGEPGAAPGDLDVLVVGSPDRTVVYRAAMALTDVLQREVNPTIVSTERWDEGEDGFIRDVKSSPLVALDLTVDE